MNKKNNKVIFITWTTYSPHSLLLSEAFNCQIFYINNLINTRGLIWKLFFFFDYLYKAIKTSIIINQHKPGIVVMQSPPSITPLVIVLYSFIKKYKTVIDSHNGAFEVPWDSIPFYKWILRRADIVIVHNQQLLKKLYIDKSYNGINFKILNSRLSNFSSAKRKTNNKPHILVVSTFSGDEPMEILLQGLRMYSNDNNSNKIIFKLTGKYEKNPNLYNEFKNDDNIEFLGFVSDEHYKDLMANAFGVISLSTRDDVQQFALMEAIGNSIPFISNINITNSDLYQDKMVLVEITPEKIAEGLALFIKDKPRYDKNILELKTNIQSKWENDFASIKNELGDLL